VPVRVTLNLKGLAAFRVHLEEAASSPGGGFLRDAWIQVAVRYRAFLQERFSLYSKGGGNWKPLAESTIKGRTRAPITRLNLAVRQGLRLTAEQYAKRLTAARRKAAKHWKKYQEGEAKFAILVDTGLMFAALNPIFTDAPGQYQEETPGGIAVGFGGPERHPDGGPTIADIARFHNDGGGNLPQRKIVVPPTEDVKDAMVTYLQRGMNRYLRNTK
jgi:hypothetical protein